MTATDTATLALGAVVAAIYGLQAYLMRQTLVETNRAYLCLKEWLHFSIRNESGEIVAWRIVPKLENIGETPTRKFSYSSTTLYLNGPIPEGFRFNTHSPIFNAALGPKQYMLCGEALISVGDLNRIKTEMLHLYMFGHAEYRDRFSRKLHRTEYCNRIFPLGDPADANCIFNYTFHSDFNNFDKECQTALRKRLRIPEPRTQSRFELTTKLGEVVETSQFERP